MLRARGEQAGTTSRAWGVPKPPVITLIHGTRVTVRIAGTTPAPALLAVEGVEVQQEHGPVSFAPCTATEVELTLAMSSQRLRLRWMSGGVGGPWSDWVSAALEVSNFFWLTAGRCMRRLIPLRAHPLWVSVGFLWGKGGRGEG